MFADIALPIIRDLIIVELNLPAWEVICHVDESVHPVLGERVINIYPAADSDGPSPDQQGGDEFASSFAVGGTIRTGRIPEDRLFEYGYAALGSLSSILLRLKSMFKRDEYKIQKRINDALPTPWKLIEVYRFQSKSPVVRVGTSHFHADPEHPNDRTDFGLWSSLSYGQSRYMADLELVNVAM